MQNMLVSVSPMAKIYAENKMETKKKIIYAE